ncbi:MULTISPECIES: carbohydrate kinase family protein [unclassified Acidisoma]|uniref:carbohydrate kinase family protein n=1 Tax=unclassified Acidisoma TaxID=2634065 RepID=UPI00131BB509|nr:MULTISPECIES: sugar kinase [unclassified Acidisoma]
MGAQGAPFPRRVLVVGDVMTDVIVRAEGPLIVGSDRRAAIRSMPGGSGANQAAWLNHFGVAVSFAGRVGEGDIAAQRLAMEALGISPFLGADPVRPTGTLVALVDPTGERSFFTDRGANDGLCVEDLPDALLDGADLLQVSGYALITPSPRSAVLNLMARARARRVKVTVDPGSVSFIEEVGAANFLSWTRGASICFPNSEEAALLAGTPDREEQFAILGKYYELVVIKLGNAGAIAGGLMRDRWAQPAPTVEVLDTTGAGDAFLAGYLSEHLGGGAIERCLSRGVEAGASAAVIMGGQPVSALGGGLGDASAIASAREI